MVNDNEDKGDLSLTLYKPTWSCLEIRLFYVRVGPCAVNAVPENLTVRHLRREIGSATLEINGSKIPSSETASITLRRDRVDKGSAEVTYVSTDCVKISGPIEFEVCEKIHENSDELVMILCGSLERVDCTAGLDGGDRRTGWSMDCYAAVNGRAGSGIFGQIRGSSSIEVYIAGCCSGLPVILTKTILTSPRRKVGRKGMLDSIPEDEEMGKEKNGLSNGFVRQRKVQLLDGDLDDYDPDKKFGHSYGHGYYTEELYGDEDGQLSWFNAGVRVGVGIGLGMCVGVGLGVGLLMRSYQATTRNFRRSFF